MQSHGLPYASIPWFRVFASASSTGNRAYYQPGYLAGQKTRHR